jgi:hypothetical protein
MYDSMSEVARSNPRTLASPRRPKPHATKMDETPDPALARRTCDVPSRQLRQLCDIVNIILQPQSGRSTQSCSTRSVGWLAAPALICLKRRPRLLA